MIYKAHKDLFKDFEFTFLCGTLLNILSAIMPDNVFIIDFDSVSSMDIPYLTNKKNDNIEKYIRRFRNGLAHKTKKNKNFVVISNGGDIGMITIKGKNYTFDDLEKILSLIDKAIQDDNDGKSLYESESKTFDALLKNSYSGICH